MYDVLLYSICLVSQQMVIQDLLISGYQISFFTSFLLPLSFPPLLLDQWKEIILTLLHHFIFLVLMQLFLCSAKFKSHHANEKYINTEDTNLLKQE